MTEVRAEVVRRLVGVLIDRSLGTTLERMVLVQQDADATFEERHAAFQEIAEGRAVPLPASTAPLYGREPGEPGPWQSDVVGMLRRYGL
jgi:hypothetical protein